MNVTKNVPSISDFDEFKRIVEKLVKDDKVREVNCGGHIERDAKTGEKRMSFHASWTTDEII